MEEKLSINVKIADKKYPLKIDRAEEEKIRKAAKMINDSLFLYKQKYGEKDLQDYLSMVVLQYATKALELDSKKDNINFFHNIKDITHDLQEYIEQI